jgi:hypothetical protein
MKSTRPRTSDSSGQHAAAPGSGSVRLPPSRDDAVHASLQQAEAPPKPAAKPPVAAAPARATIKPFEPNANVFLFTPAPTYRTHHASTTGQPDRPEYPPVGARIDYYLAAPSGEVKLDVLDATGKVIRSYTSEARAGASPAGRGGGGRRGGTLPSTLPMKIGMNRFVWDLRYPGGAPSAADGEGGGGFGGTGPLVAPGAYRARLTANGIVRTEPFTVKIDPRVVKDGVTVADLAEQTRFALKIRDSLAEARQLAQRVRQAMDARTGDQVKLQAVIDRLVTKTGPYEDQMFIDQLSNVAREIGQADQKVGASAYERLNDLLKEWTAIKTDADGALR